MKLAIVVRCSLVLLLAVSLLPAQQATPKLELGVQYTAHSHFADVTTSNAACVFCEAIESGVGVRFTYNPSRFAALEAEWNVFPAANDLTSTNLAGGRVMQGLFGVKAGWRNRRFGLFARTAPGFLSYGHAITSIATVEPLTFRFGRVTHFTEYFGGVAEYYPARRIALRLDLGQTLTRYAGNGVADWRRDGQIGTGVSYRF